MRHWVFIFFLTGSVFLHSALRAEPSASIKFLMKEPVSMLDWGLDQIEEDLYRNRGLLTQNEENLFEPEPVIRVVYAWEENRIQIKVGLILDSGVKKTSGRIETIRSHVELVATYLRGILTMRPYDAFFRHQGFRSKDSPESLEGELVEITDILITVRDDQQNILKKCRAPLAGKEIIWSSLGGS